MAELRREMKDGSTFDPTKKVELPDEALEKIQGGMWQYSDAVDYNPAWDNVLFSGVQVVWRENGVLDHWATVKSFTTVENKVTSFDLDLVYENYYVYGVPAHEVMIQFPG